MIMIKTAGDELQVKGKLLKSKKEEEEMKKD